MGVETTLFDLSDHMHLFKSKVWKKPLKNPYCFGTSKQQLSLKEVSTD